MYGEDEETRRQTPRHPATHRHRHRHRHRHSHGHGHGLHACTGMRTRENVRELTEPSANPQLHTHSPLSRRRPLANPCAGSRAPIPPATPASGGLIKQVVHSPISGARSLAASDSAPTKLLPSHTAAPDPPRAVLLPCTPLPRLLKLPRLPRLWGVRATSTPSAETSLPPLRLLATPSLLPPPLLPPASPHPFTPSSVRPPSPKAAGNESFERKYHADGAGETLETAFSAAALRVSLCLSVSLCVSRALNCLVWCPPEHTVRE